MALFDLVPKLAYRYENKFVISKLTRPEIEMAVKLHPALFSEIFHERTINNIYFDSLDLKSYFDNLAGVSERYKFRIRWYGNTFGLVKNPVLEIKIKQNALGQKLSYPLADFVISDDFSLDTIQSVFLRSQLPAAILAEFNTMHFVFINSYRRKYFESFDHKFRLTIDSRLKFYRLSNRRGRGLSVYGGRSGLVVELKYSSEHSDLADQIAGQLPFRITKNSKYVAGVEALYAWLGIT